MKKKIIPKFKWKIFFELENIQIEDGDEIKGDDIVIRQIGDKKDKKVKGEIFFETEYDDNRIISDVEKKLDEFLNITALYHFSIGINSEFILQKYGYKLENHLELIKAGITPKVKGKLVSNAYTELSQDFLKDLPSRIKTLNKSKYKSNIDYLLKQYRVAYWQDDSFIRYEQLWITFMTMLNSLKPNSVWSDKKLINDFACGAISTLEKKHVEDILNILSKSAWKYDIMILGPHMKEEKCGNFIDFLIKIEIPQWQNPKTYSEELKDLIDEEQKTKKVNNREKLMKILLCLYGIRNQLFHRTDYVFNELNIGRMRLACFIFATVLRVSINSYVAKYTDLR